MAKKILAIGAHPDDMEQYVGGTLILLKNAGHRITIAALTDGACGSKTATAEEIIAIRLKEAKKAAEKIGAKYVNLGIRDGSIEYSLDNTKMLVALLRDVQPDVVFTHPTKDYMTDHWHTGALVLWAVAEAAHPNFAAPTEAAATTKWPHVYHTDPQGLVGADGQIARVNTIVDITDAIEQKLEAFAEHASQMGFLKQHRQKGDACEKTRRWAISRGEQARVEYGEGFSQNLLAEFPRNNILMDLLPGKVYTL